MAKPNLKVVRNDTLLAVQSEAKPQSAEHRLRRLFAEERRLEHELLKVRNSLRFERNRFAAGHGLLVPPRMELLRSRFAAPIDRRPS
jgi:hypothetical protein